MSFIEKMFKKPFWFHFLIWYAVTYLMFYFGLKYLSDGQMFAKASTLRVFVGLSGAGIIVGLFVAWTVSMMNQSEVFYKEADRIEEMIRGGVDEKETLDALYALKKKSMHSQTGNRMRELAKMAELKYGVKILKYS